MGHGIGIRVPIYLEDDEGCENCNEDDEERKDVELIGSSIKRQVIKEKEGEDLEIEQSN